MIGELVVADQGAVGLTSRRTEFRFVNLLEGLALIEFHRLIEILEKLPLGKVEHPQFQLGTGLGVLHEIVQTTPRTFQLLKRLVVHDRGQLLRHDHVDGSDGTADRLRHVFVEAEGSLDRFLDQRTNQFITAGLLNRLGHHLGDLVEQAACRLRRCGCASRCALCFSSRTHAAPPSGFLPGLVPSGAAPPVASFAAVIPISLASFLI